MSDSEPRIEPKLERVMRIYNHVFYPNEQVVPIRTSEDGGVLSLKFIGPRVVAVYVTDPTAPQTKVTHIMSILDDEPITLDQKVWHYVDTNITYSDLGSAHLYHFFAARSSEKEQKPL